MSAYKPAWHLKGKPYAVQLEAMKRTKGHDKFGWWVQQGLGKSALAVNEYIESWSDLDTIVVLSPNSFKPTWAETPAEWGVSSIKTAMWPDDEMKRGTSSNPRMNIMNYEAVRGSGHAVLAELMDKRPTLFIVDESSAIKNFKSKTAKAVLDLSRRAKGVRLLNGTPMAQNVMDLYPQLKALGELKNTNPYAFRNHFAVMGGFMGKVVKGIKNETELHKILDACSFRALKQDWWQDCPEKINVPLRLEMTDKQRKHYREMLQDFFTLVGKDEFSADLVLVQLDKLRQLSSGLIMDGDKFTLIDEIGKNPKYRAALDLMETGTGKMVVVHFYKKMGNLLYEEFKKEGLNPAYIRGQMKPDEIIAQKKKFNDDPDCRIIVCQIGAAHLGHTLLGGSGNDRAHKMFFHDLTFSYLVKSQMDDRIHRGVQDRACLYYHPLLSTIDEAQVKALTTKGDMASMVVDAVRALRSSVRSPGGLIRG